MYPPDISFERIWSDFCDLASDVSLPEVQEDHPDWLVGWRDCLFTSAFLWNNKVTYTTLALAVSASDHNRRSILMSLLGEKTAVALFNVCREEDSKHEAGHVSLAVLLLLLAVPSLQTVAANICIGLINTLRREGQVSGDGAWKVYTFLKSKI